MSPEEIKQLRAELGCSIGELAGALGVEVKDLLDWESGERFPTKRHSEKLAALRAAGPSAVPRRGRRPAPERAGAGTERRESGESGREASRGGRATPAVTGLSLLADPRLWSILRKLLAHPELFARVEGLAEQYPEP